MRQGSGSSLRPLPSGELSNLIKWDKKAKEIRRSRQNGSPRSERIRADPEGRWRQGDADHAVLFSHSLIHLTIDKDTGKNCTFFPRQYLAVQHELAC